MKLQNLKFTKGTQINTFVNGLKTTIKHLYGIADANTISSIALNHVINNLNSNLREEARLFQLSGNKNIENLLEFISVKMGMTSLSNIDTAAALKRNKRDDRIERLENLEKVLTKLDQHERKKQICEHCQKKWVIRSKPAYN